MLPLRKVDDWMHRLGNPVVQVSEFELRMALRDLDQGRVDASAMEEALLRGLALGRLGRHADALDAFDQAVALGNGSWEVHRNRGVALLHLESFEASANALVHASECEGGYNTTVLCTLAGVFTSVGAFSAAREVLDGAIDAAATSEDSILIALTANDLGEPALTLRFAAEAAGQGDREDLEAVARELLERDIPEGLQVALTASLLLLEHARLNREKATPTDLEDLADDGRIEVLEAFTPLRKSANAMVLGETNDSDESAE